MTDTTIFGVAIAMIVSFFLGILSGYAIRGLTEST
jgi:hypothetical protein